MHEIEAWKIVILSRYCGEFVPATEADASIRKSSETICQDLAGMGAFSVEEISFFLVKRDYFIGFEDSEPVWLMKREEIPNMLNE
jgi:hypothetical protein